MKKLQLKKQVISPQSKNNYNVFSKFIYRIPALEQTKLNLIGSQFYSNSVLFKEGVLLASPDLYNEMDKWNNRELKPDESFLMELSLLKYYLRMSNRCTPFGLFAGCGTGSIEDENKIIISPIDKHISNTRLDMNYLCSLIKEILSKPEVQKQLKYYPNTSLYESGLNYRYVEYKYLKNNRKHYLTSLQKDLYLELVLQKADTGIMIKDLIHELVCDDISVEDAEDYISDLLNSQVLVSELEPSVTGEELLSQLTGKLKKLENTEELVQQLNVIRNQIQSIDLLPIGRSVENYQLVHEALKIFKLPIDEKYLFQSDLFINCDIATISNDMVDMVLDGISVLNRLTIRNENQHLKKFKEEFYTRYENEEIPLIEALDTEIGIGFAEKGNTSGDINPLVDDVMIYRQTANSQVTLSPITGFIQKKYEEYISDPLKTEIELTEAELKQFPLDWDDLPNTFSSMIEVVDNKPGSPQIVLNSIGGSGAANLLGRFCHINEDIENLVKEITQKEQELDQDRIIAEIVHLPESRTGNILYRPTIRDYEIAYLANSSVDKEHTINPIDIMVSVVNGKKIVLRSKRLNKELIPRLTTAHNFSFNALPVYQFLCNMQTQNLCGGLGFNWGSLLDKKEYLPRVEYKNMILSSAKWNISSNDVKHIPKISHKDFLAEVDKFRTTKKLPEKVLLVQGDNKLLIDFNHPVSVQLLFDETKNKGFRLEEYLFSNNNALVTRGEENFTNQLVLCFYKSGLKEKK